MGKSNTIQIFEHETLKIGQVYDGLKGRMEFTDSHFQLLAKYLTGKPDSPFFRLYHKSIKFNQYVGVIKAGDLTIEVLPKPDKSSEEKEVWQKVLIEMLIISLHVQAQTTSHASINIRRFNVLEVYLQVFIDEAERLIHRGLIKKYRSDTNNQTALKGKLLVHQHVTKNAVHQERFYVTHTVYDGNNIYNFLIRATLECIIRVGNDSLCRQAQALLLFFPECRSVSINEKLFSRLSFDRKTESYRRSLDLARIILLNYHPDLQTGNDDVLAIMFDMNYLWEVFVYWALKRAARKPENISVRSQIRKAFWQPENGYRVSLKPDMVIDTPTENIVVDAKWKYKSQIAVEDLRQLYVYEEYFQAEKGYLLYPDQVEGGVRKTTGKFIGSYPASMERFCGLLFVDLIKDKKLNRDVGEKILEGLNI